MFRRNNDLLLVAMCFVCEYTHTRLAVLLILTPWRGLAGVRSLLSQNVIPFCQNSHKDVNSSAGLVNFPWAQC